MDHCRVIIRHKNAKIGKIFIVDFDNMIKTIAGIQFSISKSISK
jgi:hypothetical protein